MKIDFNEFFSPFQRGLSQPHFRCCFIEVPIPRPQKHSMTLHTSSSCCIVTQLNMFFRVLIHGSRIVSSYIEFLSLEFIRNHVLIYINRKYVSYLLLRVKNFRCKFYSAKSKTTSLLYILKQIIRIFCADIADNQVFKICTGMNDNTLI